MSMVKKRVYLENRPAYRKYELTGDILTANPLVALVEEAEGEQN